MDLQPARPLPVWAASEGGYSPTLGTGAEHVCKTSNKLLHIHVKPGPSHPSPGGATGCSLITDGGPGRQNGHRALGIQLTSVGVFSTMV